MSDVWISTDSEPDIGRKFVIIYDDGSGVHAWWRLDNSYIECDGLEVLTWSEVSKNCSGWIYIPTDTHFWVEDHWE